MKKKIIIIALLILSVFMITVIIISANPIISCEFDLPEGYIKAISEQARGIYSYNLPLFAVYVSVEDFSEGEVFYTVYYFPFGSVEMSYSEVGSYNMYKPLLGI